jgi:hypothetical protein
MKILYILPFLFASACSVQQEIQSSKMDIENMKATAEIYINNMPTMGDPPSPYAIITLTKGEDTLKHDWSLSSFTLMDDEGTVLQQLINQAISVEYTRKLKTSQAITVRELTSPLPTQVSIRINIINENGLVHELEIDHIAPMYLE